MQLQQTPWYDTAIFYHIYPLGLCNAPEKNTHESPVDRISVLHDWIPHLQSLGVNAVYLGPLQASESHGYDPIDYYQVDPRLGTDEQLQTLINALHQAGIRVIFDAVLNHVSRDFFAFQDVLKNGETSRYCSWFQGLDFNGRSPSGDPFAYEGWSGHYNLVKLNLNHPEVQEHLFGAVRHWIDTFAIDGLRLDAADVMDPLFLKQLANMTAHYAPDFWLMGEVVHGDYTQWANDEMLHATTNYECYKGLYSSHNDRNYFELAHSLQRLFNTETGVYRHLSLYNFADNHDVERIASILTHTPHLYPLHLLLYTIPGVPSLYYGSEWGLAGKKQHGSDRNLRPALDINALAQNLPETALAPDLLPVLQRLARVRQAHPALQQGLYQQVSVASEQFAFMRSLNEERILVVANAAEQAVEWTLDLSSLPAGRSGREVEDLLNQERFQCPENTLTLTLPPCWGRILRI